MARMYRETVTTPAAAAGSRLSHPPFVSLLSDFGLRDPSAGIMRAVIAGICPRAIVVDLSHEVDKFAIRDGALLLWSALPYLPTGTHVAVVDPGVGTARQGVVLRTARGDHLVGPDNGLLMPAAARLGGITAVHLLENPRYALPDVSSSFHGRDIFAPAGAHLAAGLDAAELGREVDPRRLLDLDWPRPEIRAGRLRTHALYLDTFGNVKLSALIEDLVAALPGLRHGERLVLHLGQGGRGGQGPGGAAEVPLIWARTFGDVPEGAALLTADSYGRVALSVHQGSATARYGIARDAELEIGRPPAPAPAGRPRSSGPRSGRPPAPPVPPSRPRPPGS